MKENRREGDLDLDLHSETIHKISAAIKIQNNILTLFMTDK